MVLELPVGSLNGDAVMLDPFENSFVPVTADMVLVFSVVGFEGVVMWFFEEAVDKDATTTGLVVAVG